MICFFRCWIQQQKPCISFKDLHQDSISAFLFSNSPFSPLWNALYSSLSNCDASLKRGCPPLHSVNHSECELHRTSLRLVGWILSALRYTALPCFNCSLILWCWGLDKEVAWSQCFFSILGVRGFVLFNNRWAGLTMLAV